MLMFFSQTSAWLIWLRKDLLREKFEKNIPMLIDLIADPGKWFSDTYLIVYWFCVVYFHSHN